MAEADLDAIIRQLSKQQTRALTAAVKKRRAGWLARAAKAKDAAGKAQAKAVAAAAYEQGQAAVRRLQMAADNAADSYARAVRKAAEDAAAKAAADAAAGKAAAEKAESKKKPAKAPAATSGKKKNAARTKKAKGPKA